MTVRGTERVVDMFLSGTGRAGVEKSRRNRTLELPIDTVAPNPKQPRKEFDPKKISELSKSIKEYGVLQPIGVRVIQDGYEIVYGERRWRASNEAGLKTIPCVIVPGDADLKTIALIENIHRQDLSAMEKAMAIKDMMVSENLSMDAVGKKLGLGKTRVHQLINILNLPEEMLAAFCRANLNETHARALLLLKKYPEPQKELLQDIVVHGLTGNQAIAQADEYVKGLPVKSSFSQMINKSISKLDKIEKSWRSLQTNEREDYAKELMKLREKIDYLLGNS